MHDRLATLIGDLPFDKVNLSFGEFFGADPDQFIAQLNVAYDELQAIRPGMELSALIHVETRRISTSNIRGRTCSIISWSSSPIRRSSPGFTR